MYGKSDTSRFDVISGDDKGVAIRLDEKVMPPEYKVDEFQLYEDDAAFDNKYNKNVMHNSAETRKDIPRLMQFATRATSNGSRRVNTNLDSLSRASINFK